MCGENRVSRFESGPTMLQRILEISALHLLRCCTFDAVKCQRNNDAIFLCCVCATYSLVATFAINNTTTRNCHWACVRVPPYVACCWQRLISRVLRHAPEAPWWGLSSTEGDGNYCAGFSILHRRRWSYNRGQMSASRYQLGLKYLTTLPLSEGKCFVQK